MESIPHGEQIKQKKLKIIIILAFINYQWQNTMEMKNQCFDSNNICQVLRLNPTSWIIL